VNGTRVKKPCPECGNLYVHLYDHIRRFHRGVKKAANTRYCFSCQKSFPKDTYNEHKVNCKEEENVCHICSKKVVKIKDHLARYHQIFDRKCHLCGNFFQTTVDLNKHLREVHFPKMMMEPELHRMNLSTEDAIQRENIATQFVELYSRKLTDTEEQIECSFCKYKTTTVINMIIHMKEHLGFTHRKGTTPNLDKETVCPYCGKIVKFEMKKHMERCKMQMQS